MAGIGARIQWLWMEGIERVKDFVLVPGFCDGRRYAGRRKTEEFTARRSEGARGWRGTAPQELTVAAGMISQCRLFI